jgi:serine/threonine-protein kinase RIM15
MAEEARAATLAPPAVTALREEASASSPHRVHMERTVSQDIREEREDLKEAAEHSLNVIMDLELDGNVRYVTESWKDVIGTLPSDVVGKPVADVLGNGAQFAETIESIKKDDSRSRIIRFAVPMGPLSVLRRKRSRRAENEDADTVPPSPQSTQSEEEQMLNLEAQGIMVYDRTTGVESHTMWMIRPSVIREVTIDLPAVLVESLGVGAEMLAHYLTSLAEQGANDPGNHPPPPPVLCRICERHITPWWFEKHTELCLQEHRAESDVLLAQESLADQRNAIVKVLDALDAQGRQPRATSAELAQPPSIPEYKGALIQPASTPSSGTPSGRNSPASPPAHSRERSSGFGHHRARSFAVRRPLARIVELVLDLCDTALEINTPAIKDNIRAQSGSEIRTQSPQSENRISQVLQWQSPTSGSTEHGEGFRMLCDDTAKFARAKVDAVVRHRRILEYSERIRQEFDILVQECIEAAMTKAARIAAGEDSSSEDDQLAEEEEQFDNEEVPTGEEGIFPCSFDGPSAMAQALRNASDPSLPARVNRRESSVAGSTRSSSPRGGSQTPRSHAGAINIATQNKRQSMHFESDAGADSDSSVRSSVLSGPRRADSPGSEAGLNRVASSRDRKRKSLVLPSVMSSRQHSPARSMVPPSSPLRMNKPRIPSGVPSGAEGLQSPITSPVLTTTEFSSPAISMVQAHHHRRQSSTAGSDGPKPISPRLIPMSAPQPRAVPPSIKDFEIIKPISKGAFGSVYLAKKKTTGEYFAIKVLKKADMVAKNQITNVKAERAIMMWQGESDFVAKLYWTFSSKDYLYLVMEYLNGGDCASLIKVLGSLPEDWAKKYLAEVVLGVEHLHSRGIVHRDLKPDNLLIDQKGHLKLTDFGLSRMGLIGRQKRALNSKPDDTAPDLLKTGPFHRATSMTSSRSASFDLNPSPNNTPNMTPALAGELGQPSYFSLSREGGQGRDPSRRTSGNRSESGDSEAALQAMFRRFSLVDDQLVQPRSRSPIEEEGYADEGSPDLFPLAPTISQSSAAQNHTPPPTSSMLPPPMALFDPEDSNRRFVGTPDYLAPETVGGSGQDEVSDWWSLGCILFECLYGYPPFHAETPDEVFQNILARRICWPEDEDDGISDEAKDLINRLMCTDPTKRLGANAEEKFASGGEEIRSHPWFADLNWESLRDDEASFIPNPENPEDTEYFDNRGAAMQNFAEFEDQGTSSAGNTPGADYPERPHDALSRVRSQVSVTTMKRGLIPLHIPAHVREGRSRRLSEPVATDDFGSFTYKNLPVLEKANKDVIQKLRAEAMQSHNKPGSALQSPGVTSPSPSLDSSPMLPAPLKRTLSTNKATGRPSSPSISGPASSPNRGSQPSSPLLVQFSTGQHHERRKTSSSGSTLSQTTSNPSTLQPGAFFDAPRLGSGFRSTPDAISPIKLVKTPSTMSAVSTDKGAAGQRQTSLGQTSFPSPRARSQTMGSQDGDTIGDLIPNHHKRRSQVFDVSPSSSDTEDSRAKALLRVQRRRQSSRRLSQISLADGPIFRPLDVLVCEDHPVSRLVMEKLLEKLRCRTLTVTNGSEAVRYAMGEVKFDIIMMEFKLPQVNGADVARMIRDTKNANSNTPIVAVTGYLKELQAPHHFDALIEKPPTTAKLSDILGKLCQWRAAPPNWTPTQSMYPSMMPSGLRQESTRQEDSPTSNSSGFPPVPSGSYRGSSREDSISSSFFGDNDSRAGDDVPVIVARHHIDDWRERDIARAMSGLGISEDAVETVDPKNVGQNLPIPHDLSAHGMSAPAVMENATIRKQRSAELVGAKRRVLETRKHESAESGDDEDDELGNVNARAKSPKSRPKSSSKLGIEMMRTNSRGSVISVEDIAHPDSTLASSPPPAITEDQHAEEREADIPPVSLTPPEIFPRAPGGAVEEIEMETPKASEKQAATPDPDPTPRANVSPDA